MDDLERIGTIKYEEFFRDFLEPNQPCVFSSEVTEHWRSRQEWIIDQRPHFEFLSKEFGNFNIHFFYSACMVLWSILVCIYGWVAAGQWANQLSLEKPQ